LKKPEAWLRELLDASMTGAIVFGLIKRTLEQDTKQVRRLKLRAIIQRWTQVHFARKTWVK
jgi:hypothetical protein